MSNRISAGSETSLVPMEVAARVSAAQVLEVLLKKANSAQRRDDMQRGVFLLTLIDEIFDAVYRVFDE